ncbi:MAG TPA: hypothetical protein VGN95_03835 [Pyrinomonadaceae bacterium]|nr:hypothetical protein [Pyrinomonadaceae bacterium]
MSKVVAKVCFFLAALILIAELVYVFFAYIVTSQSADGLVADGLGRPLVPTPALVKYFFGQDRMWAGWQWFIGEMVVFWGLLFLLIALSKKAFPDDKQSASK